MHAWLKSCRNFVNISLRKRAALILWALSSFMVITHYREISAPESVFQKDLPSLTNWRPIETDGHMGSYIILWGCKTEFFHYPKSYLSWNLIRKKKIIHKLKRVFPNPSEVNGWVNDNPYQSQWLDHMYPLLKGYRHCGRSGAERSQIRGNEIIVLVYELGTAMWFPSCRLTVFMPMFVIAMQIPYFLH